MMFSVIIPVYNVEKYITKCLKSILNQTYSDYEIIIVNDGSTDSSIKILEKYQSYISNLKIINQQNRGLGGARNTGIRYARGDYLVFLDSDDYVAQNMLETIDMYLKKYNLDIIAFDCIQVDTEGNILQNITNDEYKNYYTDLTKQQYLLLEPTSCTKVYKRTLYTTFNIYFPEKLWYEDLATIFKLVKNAKKNRLFKISFILLCTA